MRPERQSDRAIVGEDLFVFREGDQTGVAADNDNLIFIMNTNDRSLARQQYYFNTNARYEFLVDESGLPIDDAWRAARTSLLLETFARVEPAVLLVETFPFGRKLLSFEIW